jgi:hypothetical protein
MAVDWSKRRQLHLFSEKSLTGWWSRNTSDSTSDKFHCSSSIAASLLKLRSYMMKITSDFSILFGSEILLLFALCPCMYWLRCLWVIVHSDIEASSCKSRMPTLSVLIVWVSSVLHKAMGVARFFYFQICVQQQ